MDAFFDKAGERGDFKKGREFRVRQPDFVDDSLTLPLAKLQQAVVETLRGIEDETAKAELQDLGRRIRDARSAIATFLKQEAEDHVYWIEKDPARRSIPCAARRAHRRGRLPARVALSRGQMLHHDQRDALRRGGRPRPQRGGPGLLPEPHRSRRGGGRQIGSPSITSGR